METEEVDISELISRSVRTAMAPLTTEIKAVTARIDSTASEVQKLSVRQPTAKGMADVFEDEVDHDAVKRASADAAARTEMMRSAMGLRRPVTAR